MQKLQNLKIFVKSRNVGFISNYKSPVFLFLAALIIRLVYFHLNNSVAAFYDVYFYIKLAQRLVAGDLAGGLDPFWAPLYPILIAILAPFCDSFLTATFIISFVAGSLISVATYYLVKQSYGEKEAFIAGIIAAFFPHLTNITFQLGTENIYSLFVIIAVCIFWKALAKGLNRDFLLTGAMIGLAYLTRPEAFGYLFFFTPLIFIKFFSGQKRFSRISFKYSALLLLGFALLASPYIFYLRSATGTWTVSAKFNHLILGSNFSNNLDLSKDNNKEIQETLKSNYLLGMKQILHKSVGGNLKTVRNLAYQFFPPYLFMFIALGLFRTKWSLDRFKREMYLSLFCLVTLLGYLVTVIEMRYFFVLLPVLIGWVARGIVETENWLNETLKANAVKQFFFNKTRLFPYLMIVPIFIYTLPLNPFYRQPNVQWGFVEGRFEEKKAGHWLRENAKPNPVIMGNFFITALYSEGEYFEMPTNSVQEVFSKIKEKNVDYLVVLERDIKYTPAILSLFTEPQNYPELEIIYQANDHPNYKIIIYQIKKESVPKEQ